MSPTITTRSDQSAPLKGTESRLDDQRTARRRHREHLRDPIIATGSLETSGDDRSTEMLTSGEVWSLSAPVAVSVACSRSVPAHPPASIFKTYTFPAVNS